MKIRNNDDLRLAYELLSMLDPNIPRAAELRKSIRSYNHLPTGSHKIIKDDGFDGYIELVKLPEFLGKYDIQYVEEWFEAEIYIYPTYSMYDCTGRPFTNWYKAFKRRGSWYAYHSVGFDV